jgi:hypothetical protein
MLVEKQLLWSQANGKWIVKRFINIDSWNTISFFPFQSYALKEANDHQPSLEM